MSNEVHLRRATPADAEICGVICFDAFAAINRQHNFPCDFPSPDVTTGLLKSMFGDPESYCVVAESGGRIIGSNCLDESSTIAGIGPITVAPDVQNQKAGRMLMDDVLERARERAFPGVRLLQAAFHSRSLSLYSKLGFITREPISTMQGAPIKRTIPGYATRSATEADLDAANQVCYRVHGHTRVGDLRDGLKRGTAVVVEREGRITGYASGLAFFDHAVAESNADLQALIASAHEFGGPGILVPTRNYELFRWCLDNGLRVVQPMTLMTIGLYNEPVGAYLPSVLY